MVSRAVPGIWELVSPAKSLVARQDGAIAALRRLLTAYPSPIGVPAPGTVT